MQKNQVTPHNLQICGGDFNDTGSSMAESATNSTNAVLDTIIIQTTQMEKLAKFYRQGLELEPPDVVHDDHLGFSAANIYFGFDQVGEIDGGYPGPISLWFEVDDLEATFNRFAALGAKVKYGPTKKHWGATLAAIFDPDGNVVGLAQRGTNL
jgi:predicted enzyme related to lactoylglutathione lyase